VPVNSAPVIHAVSKAPLDSIPKRDRPWTSAPRYTPPGHTPVAQWLPVCPVSGHATL